LPKPISPERVLAFVVKTQMIGTEKKNHSVAQKGLIWVDIKTRKDLSGNSYGHQ